MNKSSARTTHFGYRDVPVQDKTALVKNVFDSVADSYDVMNDLMSLGVHRLWKRHFVGSSEIRPGDRVLDLAGGTGDITALLSKKVGGSGLVVLSDINASMVSHGRAALEDQGILGNVRYTLANAEVLPFRDQQFDAVTMAFGLRNVTEKAAALKEMLRVLKPGGQAHILEFSKVRAKPLKALYDRYSFGLLPLMGKLVAGDRQSYQYLAESIRKHPTQAKLAGMMEEAGFKRVRFRNLSGGIVAIHRGYRD